jgi:hypothetical protein
MRKLRAKEIEDRQTAPVPDLQDLSRTWLADWMLLQLDCKLRRRSPYSSQMRKLKAKEIEDRQHPFRVCKICQKMVSRLDVASFRLQIASMSAEEDLIRVSLFNTQPKSARMENFGYRIIIAKDTYSGHGGRQ